MTSRQTSASGKNKPGPAFNAGIYLRLTVAAWTAYFAAKHPGENSSVVLGMVLGFMPFTVLFPASWRDQVSYRWCEKWVFWIASALPALAIVAAFADSDLRSPGYPRVALIVAGAAAHSALIVLIARPGKADVMNIWFWSSGAVVATVGVLTDLPNAPGWHALAFFAYGALASGAFRSLVDEPQQDLGKDAAESSDEPQGASSLRPTRAWVQSLRKSPTLWFWFTLLFLFLTISSLAPLVREEDQIKGWIGWVAAVLILYTAALSVVYLPRAPFPEDVRPAIYWAFAISPVLVGMTVPLLGGGQWVGGLGFVVSVALLWRARTLIKKSAI